MHRPFPSNPPNIPKVGIIGRISFSHKGQDRAIEAANFLRQRGKNIDFVIVGDGQDKIKLETLIEKNDLMDSFVIKKWEENKNRIYSGLDCVLITSHFEGVPLVLLEGISFNRLTFAPSQGVFSEYLPKDFLYSDPTELLHKLIKFDHYWKIWRKKEKKIFRDMARRNGNKNYHRNLLSIIKKLDVE
jgi:glycosyltransferase involved in cell wall biosynthesis